MKEAVKAAADLQEMEEITDKLSFYPTHPAYYFQLTALMIQY